MPAVRTSEPTQRTRIGSPHVSLTSAPEPILGDRFVEALAYAVELLGGQARKATTIPYLSHVLAVCSLVLEDGGTEDEAMAALLHDGPAWSS